MRDDVAAALHRLLVDLESPRCLDEWAPGRQASPSRVAAAGAVGAVGAKDEPEADLKKAA